jgi:hypothetical protein
MGLIDFPDPIAMFEGAKNAGLEREIANSFVSVTYSTWISALWRSGLSKWAQFTGEGQALKDAATSAYLCLSGLETNSFLHLTVPLDLLDPDNLSRFRTEHKENK